MNQWASRKIDYRWAIGLIVVLATLDIVAVFSSWNTPINISNNPGISDRPSIATDASGQIHMVWADNSINYPGNSEIIYRSSLDGGATWNPATPINISNSATQSFQPDIAVAGTAQRIVTWIDNGETYATLWTGSTWGTPAQLSSTVTPTLQLSSSINTDGIALVAWTEGYGSLSTYGSSTTPATQGFYRRWDGSTWSAAQPLDAHLVAMRGNLAYLATEDGMLLQSNNAGQTWSTPLHLSQQYGIPGDMVIDSAGTVHLAWLTSSNVLAGSYDGHSFSAPALVASWDQFNLGEANTPANLANGYASTLALAVNAHDHLDLIWAAPDLKSASATTYNPAGINGLGGDMRFRIMSSQSFDSQTWTTPVMQAADGGFPAITAATTSDDFYGTWRSTGTTPDVFIAVNHKPDPLYTESFDTPARLFAKGVDVISGTAKLNSASPNAWPLFGYRQYYGQILRDQLGATSLVMLDTCLTKFNALTGRIESLPQNLCLPEYSQVSIVGGVEVSRTPSRMRAIDGLLQGDTAYVLADSRAVIDNASVYTPHVLLMNLATGDLKDIGQPAGTSNIDATTAYAACDNMRSCTQLVVDPTGKTIYLVIKGQLYRYSLASAAWTATGQSAAAVVVSAAGTVYVRNGTSLLSSSDGAAFVERSASFGGSILYIDRAGHVHGLGNGLPVSTLVPDTGIVRTSSTSLKLAGPPAHIAATEDADGTLYIFEIGSIGTDNGEGGLYHYNDVTGQLTLTLDVVPSQWYGPGQGIVMASDDRLWMVAGTAQASSARTYGGFFAYTPNPLRGEVVSPPIASGSGSVLWGTLTYTATLPTGSSLSIDILDSEGTLLRAGVASGTNLNDLPPIPLRLRARMQASSAAATPILDSWQLTWQPLNAKQGQISPTEPSTITAADGTFQLSFPAGAVTSSTTITYTEQITPSHSLGSLRFAGRSFTIIAKTNNGTPVQTFSAPFTLILTYTDAELAAAGIIEANLDLVFWNGSQWVSTAPSIDTTNNRVSVTLSHLTEFALVQQTKWLVYVPAIYKK
jgi:hypothetical protein